MECFNTKYKVPDVPPLRSNSGLPVRACWLYRACCTWQDTCKNYQKMTVARPTRAIGILSPTRNLLLRARSCLRVALHPCFRLLEAVQPRRPHPGTIGRPFLGFLVLDRRDRVVGARDGDMQSVDFLGLRHPDDLLPAGYPADAFQAQAPCKELVLAIVPEVRMVTM